MTLAASDPTVHSAYRFGAMALLLAAAAIVIALGFEHLGGYAPCELCLQQRYAYYAGIPLLFLALVALSAGQPRAAAVLFVIVALAFLANAALGIYHAGAEWHFWAGAGCMLGRADRSQPTPATCSKRCNRQTSCAAIRRLGAWPAFPSPAGMLWHLCLLCC